jgi:hypothetical protein
MMFCNARDCTRLDCFRNINGYNFTPDEFWKDKVCIGAIKHRCKDYRKEEQDEFAGQSTENYNG